MQIHILKNFHPCLSGVLWVSRWSFDLELLLEPHNLGYQVGTGGPPSVHPITFTIPWCSCPSTFQPDHKTGSNIDPCHSSIHVTYIRDGYQPNGFSQTPPSACAKPCCIQLRYLHHRQSLKASFKNDFLDTSLLQKRGEIRIFKSFRRKPVFECAQLTFLRG